ncbi:MAG: hypothetical protein ACFCVG_13395 [Kineosporiaceae bacterium]
MSVAVAPITDADLPAVGAFLHRHLNRRVTADAWARALRVPWKVDAPDHGYLLRDDAGDVVGAYLAFYSEREIDGRRERFCNLGAWCVLPEHRFRGLRLLSALTSRPGLHYTDLSPSGSVVALNARLGFVHLDTTTLLVPNLPWPPLPGDARVVADPRRLEEVLTGPELDRCRDHAGAAAARQVVLVRDGRTCHVVFRRVRRKDLPLFAAILHVSDPLLLAGAWRSLARHLLLRHGVPFTLAERRITGPAPAWSAGPVRSRPKMVRSDLSPDRIDDLYSELTCVPW